MDNINLGDLMDIDLDFIKLFTSLPGSGISPMSSDGGFDGGGGGGIGGGGGGGGGSAC
ncbi:MAG: hypothetical protein E6231_15240 [Bacillota bacterium]|nr:hypothetical protein [Bacillota bacterium]